ncbi:cellulose-binding domain-containing protein [Planotetraspora sp. A-T 1434]|uniref:cellulose-binding domain-containing protein n=1 Tax=Planotetraspora sp. A-T 1434 TaxID=2979219 RepID=UPI0021BE449E|nr:cellulose-binding domain-containing protein [Planotetraspora sp. A-T 1434]MCT9930548.1 cellulose-binding domain-containing protein [Planotetraspora sp. A-T 1434]
MVIQPDWPATWTQAGVQVSAVNLSWNQTINPGQPTQIGSNTTCGGVGAPPSSFTLSTARAPDRQSQR